MEERYKTLAAVGVRNIEHNRNIMTAMAESNGPLSQERPRGQDAAFIICSSTSCRLDDGGEQRGRRVDLPPRADGAPSASTDSGDAAAVG
jgi:hypothetical protein